jgi:hypothetical protein
MSSEIEKTLNRLAESGFCTCQSDSQHVNKLKDMETKEEHAKHVKQELSLGLWEKYLTVWIAICIVVGLLVGRFIPAFGEFMDSLKFANLSIPIGVLLFFMMYPTVLGIRFSDIKMASKTLNPS